MTGWMISNEGIAVVGLALTILGFAVNLIFQIRRDMREQQLQQAKLRQLLRAQGQAEQGAERP